MNPDPDPEREPVSIRRWADEQQFVAQPMLADRDEKGNILPTVRLLWMTPDPLGANAAMGRMYKGIPTYSLADVTDEERRQYFEDSLATHLKAPLESIQFQFFFEGVTRSFTHQMVRIRTGCYAQESLRFAVKEDLAAEISVPPSVAALPANHPTRQVWDKAIEEISVRYNYLVANGIPAEDARGLMPHAVTTRLNMIIDLRNLADHAGNRLCTQAQFEWRIVFLGIVNAIRTYTPDFSWNGTPRVTADEWEEKYRWQFETLADSALFRPVCYQLGRCPFKASFDRDCSIRERVDKLASYGVPSERWEVGTELEDMSMISAIDPREWLADPAAARRTSGDAGH